MNRCKKGKIMVRIRRNFLILCLSILFLTVSASIGAIPDSVRVWEEDITIPTYLVGPPEPNPMFYFGQASQGAEGRIYPYPLYDNLTDEKVDKTYKMVYLENEYVRIGILPEIGGRIFEGVDKTNDYDFFYRQHVIKPALIGLIGAWISGGVEWNIPHHHRASTFIPVQYRIENNEDGSKTVWIGELEMRHRTRWAIGYTLKPGRSYLEVSLRILNRTPVVNSMLCFANVAVHTNEKYQIIFPPSTQFGTHHSKREFTKWPISTSRYGGGDFSDGVDISWYKNHISSNSVFAWNYQEDFFAGYDHGKQTGTMCVANHYVVPGKKFWTWGNGENGRMWDDILTDDDGPYVELMVGAYSDNQPDYSWLQPYEVKSFKMYYYPFRDIGGVKNANIDAAVNLVTEDEQGTKLGFYTTSTHESATMLLKADGKILLQEKTAIGPGKPFLKKVSIPEDVDIHDLRASLTVNGKELIAYSPVRLKEEPMPEPVRAPQSPEEIETVEELYLTGLRIEQFHNPALDPDPYWQEALKRDPGDVRVNTALGINYLRKSRFSDSEKLFRKALERLTDKYTSPKDGEPFYYLGVALKAQGKNKEAYDYLYKATWSMAWRAAAYYNLAEIDCIQGDFNTALGHLNTSLEANALNIRALTLKASVLRRMDKTNEALKTLMAAYDKTDPLDVRLMAELWLLSRDSRVADVLVSTMNHHPATAQETAAEYMNVGLWQDGTAVLSLLTSSVPDQTKISPLVYYYLGYFAEKLGQKQKASEYYSLTAKSSPDYVFPFQWEMIDVLGRAMEVNSDDTLAPYYLGNLLFDRQPDEAVKLWEKSVSGGASFPIVYRNLAVAYSRGEKENAIEKAILNLEKAVSLKKKYPIHFFELDQLYEAAGADPNKRLSVLEQNQDVVIKRDDAVSREISLKVCMGKYDDAIELMRGRQFNIWEGGARFNVNDCWTDAHLLRGLEHFDAGRYKEALADYQASLEFPENLRASGSRFGNRRNPEISYYMGLAYEALDQKDKAIEAWEQAASSDSPNRIRRRRRDFGGNDQQYYRGMCLIKLGQDEQAEEFFQNLVSSGERMLEGTEQLDFFAKFGEQQSQRTRMANAHYLLGLGYLGLGEKEKAAEQLTDALKAGPDHLGAKIQLGRLD